MFKSSKKSPFVRSLCLVLALTFSIQTVQMTATPRGSHAAIEGGNNHGLSNPFALFIIAIGTLFVGLLIILDGPTGQELKFSAISDADATRVGLSTSEMQAFNSELEEVNAISEQIALTVRSNPQLTPEQAENLFYQSASNSISLETTKAVKKILSFAARTH